MKDGRKKYLLKAYIGNTYRMHVIARNDDPGDLWYDISEQNNKRIKKHIDQNGSIKMIVVQLHKGRYREVSEMVVRFFISFDEWKKTF